MFRGHLKLISVLAILLITHPLLAISDEHFYGNPGILKDGPMRAVPDSEFKRPVAPTATPVKYDETSSYCPRGIPMAPGQTEIPKGHAFVGDGKFIRPITDKDTLLKNLQEGDIIVYSRSAATPDNPNYTDFSQGMSHASLVGKVKMPNGEIKLGHVDSPSTSTGTDFPAAGYDSFHIVRLKPNIAGRDQLIEGVNKYFTAMYNGTYGYDTGFGAITPARIKRFQDALRENKIPQGEELYCSALPAMGYATAGLNISSGAGLVRAVDALEKLILPRLEGPNKWNRTYGVNKIGFPEYPGQRPNVPEDAVLSEAWTKLVNEASIGMDGRTRAGAIAHADDFMQGVKILWAVKPEERMARLPELAGLINNLRVRAGASAGTAAGANAGITFPVAPSDYLLDTFNANGSFSYVGSFVSDRCKVISGTPPTNPNPNPNSNPPATNLTQGPIVERPGHGRGRWVQNSSNMFAPPVWKPEPAEPTPPSNPNPPTPPSQPAPQRSAQFTYNNSYGGKSYYFPDSSGIGTGVLKQTDSSGNVTWYRYTGDPRTSATVTQLSGPPAGFEGSTSSSSGSGTPSGSSGFATPVTGTGSQPSQPSAPSSPTGSSQTSNFNPTFGQPNTGGYYIRTSDGQLHFVQGQVPQFQPQVNPQFQPQFYSRPPQQYNQGLFGGGGFQPFGGRLRR